MLFSDSRIFRNRVERERERGKHTKHQTTSEEIIGTRRAAGGHTLAKGSLRVFPPGHTVAAAVESVHCIQTDSFGMRFQMLY